MVGMFTLLEREILPHLKGKEIMLLQGCGRERFMSYRSRGGFGDLGKHKHIVMSRVFTLTKLPPIFLIIFFYPVLHFI